MSTLWLWVAGMLTLACVKWSQNTQTMTAKTTHVYVSHGQARPTFPNSRIFLARLSFSSAVRYIPLLPDQFERNSCTIRFHDCYCTSGVGLPCIVILIDIGRDGGDTASPDLSPNERCTGTRRRLAPRRTNTIHYTDSLS